MKKLRNRCKICLALHGATISISSTLAGNLTIAQMIQVLHPHTLNPKISLNSECQPQHICKECKIHLDTAFQLQQKIIQSDNRIRRALLDLKTSGDNDPVQPLPGDVAVAKYKDSLAASEIVDLNSASEVEIDDSDDDDENAGQMISSVDVEVSLIDEPSEAAEAAIVVEEVTEPDVGPYQPICELQEVQSGDKEKYNTDECRIPPYVVNCCNQCGKTFKRWHELKRHMIFHSEARPFGCEQCGKSFKMNQHLKQHIMRHEKTPKQSRDQTAVIHEHKIEVPRCNGAYPCPFCPRIMRYKHDVKRHMVSHFNKRPFRCNCGMAFKLKQHLAAHQNRYTEGHETITQMDDTELWPPVSEDMQADDSIAYGDFGGATHDSIGFAASNTTGEAIKDNAALSETRFEASQLLPEPIEASPMLSAAEEATLLFPKVEEVEIVEIVDL